MNLVGGHKHSDHSGGIKCSQYCVTITAIHVQNFSIIPDTDSIPITNTNSPSRPPTPAPGSLSCTYCPHELAYSRFRREVELYNNCPFVDLNLFVYLYFYNEKVCFTCIIKTKGMRKLWERIVAFGLWGFLFFLTTIIIQIYVKNLELKVRHFLCSFFFSFPFPVLLGRRSLGFSFQAGSQGLGHPCHPFCRHLGRGQGLTSISAWQDKGGQPVGLGADHRWGFLGPGSWAPPVESSYPGFLCVTRGLRGCAWCSRCLKPNSCPAVSEVKTQGG